MCKKNKVDVVIKGYKGKKGELGKFNGLIKIPLHIFAPQPDGSELKTEQTNVLQIDGKLTIKKN